MERAELTELHYITPIGNLASIKSRGILSHIRAAALQHETVADQDIQDLRARVRLPDGSRLHAYANLYFHARNPMMFKRLDRRHELCVLRVRSEILDYDGVVITDRNAASPYVRWAKAPAGLAIVDRELTYASDWRHQDQIEYWRRKSHKCAEVLVPDKVEPGYILGGYALDQSTCDRCDGSGCGEDWVTNPDLFFS
jgi:ssDNA thymidine ADP-ribosyltransferase, DarT